MKLRSREGRAEGEVVRTCVGCRQRALKRDLLRFVLPGASATAPLPDPLAIATGRGVYTCPRPACVGKAVQRGGFARSFRRSFQCDAKEMVEELRGTLSQSVGRMLAQLLGDGRARQGLPDASTLAVFHWDGDDFTVLADDAAERLDSLGAWTAAFSRG